MTTIAARAAPEPEVEPPHRTLGLTDGELDAIVARMRMPPTHRELTNALDDQPVRRYGSAKAKTVKCLIRFREGL